VDVGVGLLHDLGDVEVVHNLSEEVNRLGTSCTDQIKLTLSATQRAQLDSLASGLSPDNNPLSFIAKACIHLHYSGFTLPALLYNNLIVRYHCGGWSEEVNSCILISYMVYL
jgi:hypothetical protein